MNPPTPLETVSPDTLEHLFSSDPSSLSDDEFRLLILECRRRRNEFALSEAKASTEAKLKRPRAEPKSAAQAASQDKPTSELTLDDLFN